MLALGGGAVGVEVAAAFWISVGIVRTHLLHICGQLGVRSVAAAAARALSYVPAGMFLPVSRGL